MDALPDITVDPVITGGGDLCLQLDGRIVPLRVGQDPVRTFLPGWRADFACTGFGPTIALQFISENGEDAEAVCDASDAPLLVSMGPGQPSYANFSVDKDQVFSQLRTVIQTSIDDS